MGKGKRVPAILPMLSLEAIVMLLVAGGLSAAAASAGDMGGVIRLPSDAAASGKARAGDKATASTMPGDYEERPWKCCDVQVCTMSAVQPSCWCHDRLERCSDACKECRKLRGSDPPRYVCEDMYRGQPAPRCTTAHA